MLRERTANGLISLNDALAVGVVTVARWSDKVVLWILFLSLPTADDNGKHFPVVQNFWFIFFGVFGDL